MIFWRQRMGLWDWSVTLCGKLATGGRGMRQVLPTSWVRDREVAIPARDELKRLWGNFEVWRTVKRCMPKFCYWPNLNWIINCFFNNCSPDEEAILQQHKGSYQKSISILWWSWGSLSVGKESILVFTPPEWDLMNADLDWVWNEGCYDRTFATNFHLIWRR